jgi:hypothetical protein
MGSFSDETVIEKLNANFVAVEIGKYDPTHKGPFNNGVQSGEFKGGHLNGFAAAAVYTVVALPDETVIHCLPGFWQTRWYLEELDWALETARKALAAEKAEDRAGIIRKAHAERARHRTGTEAVPKNAEGQESVWNHPNDLMVRSHERLAERNPPSVKDTWEEARRRVIKAMEGARYNLTTFFQVLGD